MLKLRPTYEQMLKEARTRRLKILSERQTRTQQGILLDDVDFEEFDLSSYDKRMNISNNNDNDNPNKATQTDFNLASSSNSSVSENMRTPEEAFKEEVSEASSIRSDEKSVDRKEEKQKERSLMRRLYDSMFEEVEVDIPQSRQVSVATEESQASSSSLPVDASDEASSASGNPLPVDETSSASGASAPLPVNVKKSYEPSSSSSSSRRSSGRSALLPVEEGALSEYVQSSPPETVQSSVPSDRTVEYLQSSPPVSVASSERTIEYIRSRSSSGRSR